MFYERETNVKFSLWTCLNTYLTYKRGDIVSIVKNFMKNWKHILLCKKKKLHMSQTLLWGVHIGKLFKDIKGYVKNVMHLFPLIVNVSEDGTNNWQGHFISVKHTDNNDC